MLASPATSSSDQTSDTAAPRSRRSRVSAEHTLNRVRENQRRHRARQRDHVASLEQKLASTEKLLSEARAEIAALKQAAAASANSHPQQGQPAIDDHVKDAARGARHVEVESTGMQEIPCPAQSSQQNLLALAVQPEANIDPQLAYPDGPIPDLSFLGDPSFYLPSPTSLPTIPAAQDPSIISRNMTATGPPPCCNDPPTSPPLPSSDSPNDLECSSCKTRPPPDPSESTTLCAQAFVMIGQQNFRNLDPDTIRLWLAQGMRRAQREGEGCRVENGVLLRLLDFISGL